MKLGTTICYGICYDTKTVRGKCSWSKVPLFCWLLNQFICQMWPTLQVMSWPLRCHHSCAPLWQFKALDEVREGWRHNSLCQRERERGNFWRRGRAANPSGLKILFHGLWHWSQLQSFFFIKGSIKNFLFCYWLETVSSINKILQELGFPTTKLEFQQKRNMFHNCETAFLPFL